MVVSTPEAATVWVNGVMVGTTPWGGDITGDAPGVVEVEAPGYARWRADIPPGKATNLDARLTRKR
jgi:hypothetical protein